MADEGANGELKYPKIVCEKCKTDMKVIGIGTASGRLSYHCDTCGASCYGQNFGAMMMGQKGGKARAANLSLEKRQAIAEKAGNAFAEKMRERRRNQRVIK